MYRILQTGKLGLNAFQKKMDTISNNIANVQTHGYKSLSVQFEDLVYDKLPNRGVPLSQEGGEKSLSIGTGSKVKSIERIFEQGILENTNGVFHLGLEGEGFFAVEDSKGELLLTRDGSFSLDGNNQLVDSRGHRVMADLYGTFSRKDDISIDDQGMIRKLNNNGNNSIVGKVKLYNVEDKSVLMSRGDNYFSTEDLNSIWSNDNTQEGFGKIRQGYLEKSSVDIGKEMVDMLITQRAYQINTKSIHAADEMWSMANQLKR